LTLHFVPRIALPTQVTIVDAAIDAGVKKVVALSTDKAVNPINLYGATKLVAEKTFIAANAYSGGKVNFSVVRYGNVVGSRGSVIPLFLNFKREGLKEFPITDPRMTRFWITLDGGVDLVLTALENSVGGETFIPMIPTMKVTDLAKAIEPNCTFKTIGIRAGEKIHETLISEDEARNAKVFKNTYVILPQFYENENSHAAYDAYANVPENFSYRSDNNPEILTIEQLRKMIGLQGDFDTAVKLAGR
jgi:UDP-N-acetylglucosamine 4,6-dehydratase